jgi:pimeloyl-ACP methyl ester carboxylesterase
MEEFMDRRTILKSAASAFIGAGLFTAGGNRMSAVNATKTLTAKIPHTPFIETGDRISLYYKDWGKGKTVVFLHSWALNSDMWQYQMNFLCDQGMRCIAYDRRGHGRSSQPGHGYDYDTLAGDLESLIEQMDLRDITLVGHSMAAGEIVRYLARHGANRVVRIALLSPTTPFLMKTADNPDGVDMSRINESRARLAKDVPKALAAGMPQFLGADQPNTTVSDAMIQWNLDMCLLTCLKAMLDCNLAMIQTDFRAEMRKISLPSLVIHGDADRSAPLTITGQKSADLLKGCQLKVYEGAPHGLFITHMERLNQDLLTFING